MSTTKKASDGWHKILGYSVCVENNKIIRCMKKDENGNDIDSYAYVYRWLPVSHAWGQEAVTINAFRAGIKRGSLRVK